MFSNLLASFLTSIVLNANDKKNHREKHFFFLFEFESFCLFHNESFGYKKTILVGPDNFFMFSIQNNFNENGNISCEKNLKNG